MKGGPPNGLIEGSPACTIRRRPGTDQLIGATLACLFLRWVFGNVEHLGATRPGPGYQDWQALLMEVVLTALLVSVILGTASAAQNVLDEWGSDRQGQTGAGHRARQGRPPGHRYQSEWPMAGAALTN